MNQCIYRCMRFSLASLLLLSLTAPAAAIYSVADGDWTSPSTWDANRPPDQSANGGTGEDTFIGSDVIVPAGVNYVNTTTIDAAGNPANNNWLFFDTASPLGTSLTIQSGARVGSKHWTFIAAGASGFATVSVQSGGEFVSAGVQNENRPFTVNVASGGLLTFDASIHPVFPNAGFYRGNIFAGAAGSNSFNIEGQLNMFDMSDTPGNNAFTLINGGVIDEAARPGQAIGNASGNPEPRGNIPYSQIAVTGSGTVTNAFAGAAIANVQSGLTVDISDQSVFDSDSAAWSTYIQSGGAPTLGTDPTTIPGPRVANLPFQTGAFSGGGTIQFDVNDIGVNNQGTPADPSDDVISNVFHDSLTNGSMNPAENTFNGTIDIDYVGPEITDDEIALLTMDKPGNARQLLLINGAGSNGIFTNLVGLPVPDQVWDDGNRQFMVEFSNTFNFGDPRFVFVNIDAITVLPGGQAGDFDDDGDVDGNDFLVWQRGGSPNPISAADLTEWRTNFGAGGAPVSAVPEPSAVALLLAVAGMGAIGRRRLSKVVAANCS